jgi:hypothetical protein
MPHTLTRLLVLTMVVGLLGWSGRACAQAAERVDRVSTRGFAQTVQQLETALKGHGMMVVATVDHRWSSPWASATLA